jgi:hypothetical protein
MTEASQPAARKGFADPVPDALWKQRLPAHGRPAISNRIEVPDRRAGANRRNAHGFPPRLNSRREARECVRGPVQLWIGVGGPVHNSRLGAGQFADREVFAPIVMRQPSVSASRGILAS